VIPGGQGLTEMNSNIAAESANIPNVLWADLKAAGLLRSDTP
jgi:D-threo-aldose 1-dehydrogenase